MTLNEQRIEQMKDRIAECKRALGCTRQVGPLVLIFSGIALCLAPVSGFGPGFFGIGVITVLLAIVWAYSKSKDATQLKRQIHNYEWELATLQRDPGERNML
jgi:hypothetical protein